MSKKRVGAIVFVAAIAWIWVPAVQAANSPTFRDCALPGGFDPDFVQLNGATVGPDGSLSVIPSQNSVQMIASESPDPGDSGGHVTLTVTATADNVPTQTVSGVGVGAVSLSVPLTG